MKHKIIQETKYIHEHQSLITKTMKSIVMTSVPFKKIFRCAKISYSAHKYFKTELLVVLIVRDSKMYITYNFKLMTKKKGHHLSAFSGTGHRGCTCKTGSVPDKPSAQD